MTSNTPSTTFEQILAVSVHDVEMPAYGAYERGSAIDGHAVVLLNLKLIISDCRDRGDKPTAMMAEAVVHELLHAFEDIFNRSLSEKDIQQIIAGAGGASHGKDNPDEAYIDAMEEAAAFGYKQGRTIADEAIREAARDIVREINDGLTFEATIDGQPTRVNSLELSMDNSAIEAIEAIIRRHLEENPKKDSSIQDMA